ncbi:MAG: hypothetical protein A2Y34_11545 [Spirochaetes bacterium GWC1_27_15]|nr:MAG: hypothetical protein A2Z98_08345 [Spirochaetes bacterium GWB1_27_13]OHD23299.1 MAG: hypothetical protein A2Y34_11545 [Spirochaetes bacterium GWC1_27_15]
MKRNLIFIFMFFSFLCFANQKNFDFSTFLLSDSTTKATDQNSKLSKVLRGLDIAHIITGSVSYLGFISNSAIGTTLLSFYLTDSNYFNTNDYRNSLSITHRTLMLITYFSYGINAILGFIRLGITLYNKLPINLPHFISSIITTFFYIVGIISMGIAFNAFTNTNSPLKNYAKEIGIAHGIIFYATTISFTVAIISLPLGRKNKVYLTK